MVVVTILLYLPTVILVVVSMVAIILLDLPTVSQQSFYKCKSVIMVTVPILNIACSKFDGGNPRLLVSKSAGPLFV